MKRLKSLQIQGFRGFNKSHGPLEFDENITLIYGHNSYGKTSISEALEWLLYGETSKLEAATNNKTEYHGSYRNVHFPQEETPFVSAVFALDDGTEVVYRGELQEDDSIKRFLNGEEVDNWPWVVDAISDPKPFILQHALKNLLLANPSDRYQGFTKLIGEEELASLQEHFISLSTKYDPPKEIKVFRVSFSELEKRLSELPKFEKINKLYSKWDFIKLYDAILVECQNRTSIAFTDFSEILPEIKKIRGEAVSKLFDKQVVLDNYSEKSLAQNNDEKKFLISSITDAFSKDYLGLIEIATIQKILDRASFLSYGLQVIEDNINECPLCGHKLTEDRKTHIKHECDVTTADAAKGETLKAKRDEIVSQLKLIKQRLDNNYARHIGVSSDLLLLNNEETLQQLEIFYGSDAQLHYVAVKAAILELQNKKDFLVNSFADATVALNSVNKSIVNSTESIELLNCLAIALIEYVKNIDLYQQTVELYANRVEDARKVLVEKLDIQAGTQELSLLIDLIEAKDNVYKRTVIENILIDVKSLQKLIKDYASDKLEKTVKIDLSNNVRSWYDKIKTDGDPDVHFEGFDLPRTKGGIIKGRQISVNARSYDKALPSAISSLSESKLNALGFAISIANNIKGNSTFGFLLIDDPVQSMDDSHAVQIIDIVRNLVEEEGKQVILLSHDFSWLKDVRKNCRSMNGRVYEIVSYTQEGPTIQRSLWAAIDERFDEVKSLLAKPGLSSFESQRVAKEFRLLFNELASDLYKVKTGKNINPDSINFAIFRKLLIESGLPDKDVDKASASYNSVSNAHHSTSYNEDVGKLRDYLKVADRLKNYLNLARADKKAPKVKSSTKKAEKS